MIRLSEFGVDLPRRGWPGRRRAIAVLVLQLAAQTFLFVTLLAVMVGALVLGAAAVDALPA